MSATAKAMVYFELQCDGCSTRFEDEEGRLYPEASDARAAAEDEHEWRQQPDGRDLCRACAWTDEACAEREAVR